MTDLGQTNATQHRNQRFRSIGPRIDPSKRDRSQRLPDSSTEHASSGSDVPSWLSVCLWALLAGTALAKFTHIQTGVLIHPGVVLGSVAVILSVAMAFLATMHRVLMNVRYGTDSSVTQTLATLGAFLIMILGWAALAVIFFAPVGSAGGDAG